MKTALVLVLSAAALAGCANPYQYRPDQAALRAPMPYYIPPPAYEQPPVIFQRNLPPEPSYAPQLAPEDAVLPELPPPDAAADVPPPAAADAAPAAPVVPVPAPAVATPAAAQVPAQPDKGTDVPMMGFRPMRGQKAPGA